MATIRFLCSPDTNFRTIPIRKRIAVTRLGGYETLTLKQKKAEETEE